MVGTPDESRVVDLPRTTRHRCRRTGGVCPGAPRESDPRATSRSTERACGTTRRTTGGRETDLPRRALGALNRTWKEPAPERKYGGVTVKSGVHGREKREVDGDTNGGTNRDRRYEVYNKERDDPTLLPFPKHVK